MSSRATVILGALGLQRPEWVERAACRGYAELHGGPARDRLFFPSRGEATKPAKAICADCPVSQECLEYALVAGLTDGVWGGLSARERKRLRRARRQAVAS